MISTLLCINSIEEVTIALPKEARLTLVEQFRKRDDNPLDSLQKRAQSVP